MISTLLEISNRCRDQRITAGKFRSTLSAMGAIAVPQLVGGADVSSVEEGDDLVITLTSNPNRPFKRRRYVGKPYVARYTKFWTEDKIGFDFLQDVPGRWVGRVNRKGPAAQ